MGDLFLQSKAMLPTWPVILLSVLIAAILLLRYYRRNIYIIVLVGLLSGFSWSAWYAESILDWQLPHDWEGKPLQATGIVDSLPVTDKFGTHFIFFINELKNIDKILPGKAKIRVSWANAKSIRVGDEYQFNLHLKRLHGMRNPGGFDYEAYEIENGLRASGSVMTQLPQQFVIHHYWHSPVNQLRQYLQQRIVEHLPNSKTAPWLMALMIGERSGAPPEHWQILRATGTNHLMAIAGLHIGLISGLVFFCVKFLWRRSYYLSVRYPVPLAASVATLCSAWGYSALAGFSIPTQRACIMLTFFLAAVLLRRQMPAWHAWSSALLVVLILNPLAVLSESFWLSFGTIALIIYGMSGRLAPSGWWWKWGRVQYVIGFGLLPFSLLFYQQTSIVSVLANSIAIPWLGFLVLPFCFFSTIFLLISPTVGGLFLWIADKNLAGLWIILTWFAHLDFSVWTKAISSPWILFTTIIGCLFLLLPKGATGRWLGLLWLSPLIFLHAEVPKRNDFWMTVLDVGQGLSVVIQTKHHTLVFDAGPKFGDQFDMGESVVLPYLYVAGIKHIDSMIISHGDNDHIGGARAIMNNLPVKQILTSAVDKFPPQRATLCLAGMQWNWDGVNFKILYPFPESLTLGNDSSCVLKIDNGIHSVLLTGDIEKFAERKLLEQSYTELHADIITAPHHGSKTSSQLQFVKAVKPQYVIYATGYRNRYHFPHQPVIRIYDEVGVKAFNTMETGALKFEVTQQRLNMPLQYRIAHKHYWHD